MKNRIVLSLALGFVGTSLAAADGPITFEYTAQRDGGFLIPAHQTPDTIGFTPIPLVLTDPLIVEIKSLEVEITGLTHTSPEDLELYLIDPFGTILELMSDKGGSGDITGMNLIFNDAGVPLPPDGVALTSGAIYQPEETPGLSGTFSGQAAGPGSWTLYIIDDSLADSGSLASWTLRGTAVPEPVTLSLLALGALAFMRRRRA